MKEIINAGESRPLPPRNTEDEFDDPPVFEDRSPASERLEVRLSDGRRLKVVDVEVRYIGEDGRPLSAKEFLEQLTQLLPELFTTEEQLRAIWSNPDERVKLLTELGRKGFDGEQMETLTEMFHARDSDYFDVLAYLSFARDIISRQQRAGKVKQDKNYFDGYDHIKAKQFLQFILERYEKDGFTELNRDKLPQLIQLNNLGTPKEAANYFGGIEQLIEAYYLLQKQLYQKI